MAGGRRYPKYFLESQQSEQLSAGLIISVCLSLTTRRGEVPLPDSGGPQCSPRQDRIDVQHELLARLRQARAETDRLFQQVKPEFLYERPIPERHRIVFYVGHLEAFDWNFLRERVLGRTSFHSEFDNLFAFGIDPVDGGLPPDQPSDWPSLAQVRDYVSQARQALDEGLATGALSQLRGQEKCSRGPIAAGCHRAPLDARGDAGLHAAPVAVRQQGAASRVCLNLVMPSG